MRSQIPKLQELDSPQQAEMKSNLALLLFVMLFLGARNRLETILGSFGKADGHNEGELITQFTCANVCEKAQKASQQASKKAGMSLQTHHGEMETEVNDHLIFQSCCTVDNIHNINSMIDMFTSKWFVLCQWHWSRVAIHGLITTKDAPEDCLQAVLFDVSLIHQSLYVQFRSLLELSK